MLRRFQEADQSPFLRAVLCDGSDTNPHEAGGQGGESERQSGWGESGRLHALRARHDGQENFSPNFSRILKKSCQPPPSFSFASGFDAWPRFPRRLPFPMSSASSPTLVSAVAFSALPVRCSTRIPATASSICRNRHPPVLTIFTTRDAPMTLTTPLKPEFCTSSKRASNSSVPSFVGALKAESCSHSSSPRFSPDRWQRDPALTDRDVIPAELRTRVLLRKQ